MKNTHKYNYFKTNLAVYSKIIWQNTPNKNASTPGSAPDNPKDDKYNVDLLVQRGTVRDYIKQRVAETMKEEDINALVEKAVKEAVEKATKELIGRIDVLEKDNVRLGKHIFDLEGKVTTLENKPGFDPTKLEADIEELRNSPGFDPKALDPIKTSIDTLEKDQKRLDHDIAGTTGRVDTLENDQKRLDNDIAGTTGRVDTLENDQKRLDHDIAGTTGRVDIVEKDQKRLDHDIAELKNRPEFDTKALDPIKTSIDTLENDQKRLDHDIAETTGRVDIVEKDNIRLDHDIAELRNRPEFDTTKLETIKNDVKNLKKTDAELQKEIDDLTDKINAFANGEKIKPEELKEIRDRLKVLESQDTVDPIEFDVLKERFDKSVMEFGETKTTVGSLMAELIRLQKKVNDIKVPDIEQIKIDIANFTKIINKYNSNFDLRLEGMDRTIQEYLTQLNKKLGDLEARIKSSTNVSTTTIKEIIKIQETIKLITQQIEFLGGTKITITPPPPHRKRKGKRSPETKEVSGFMATQVVEILQSELIKIGLIQNKKDFTASRHHSKCWKYYKVRPWTNDPNKKNTDERYCLHKTGNNYLYTQAWIDFLITEFRKPGRYKEIMSLYQ
ncbi:hypothetical protein C0416_05495 [bacterium]|nr:hypothetical protein [bacterium]